MSLGGRPSTCVLRDGQQTSRRLGQRGHGRFLTAVSVLDPMPSVDPGPHVSVWAE